MLLIAAGCRRVRAGTSYSRRIAGLDVTIWPPNAATTPPHPVIVFSHGFHGCNTQSTFLTQALADAGYAVFAPNHRDAACGNRAIMIRPPTIPFRYPQRWDDAVYADRALDLKRLIDALGRDPRYGSLDWSRLGLVGHSLGGFTVLRLAGASRDLRDARVKAVLALSPYSQPLVVHEQLGGIDVPAMYQGGTLDFAMTPTIERVGGAYDQTPPPKYFVKFEGAGHLAWSDASRVDHDAIVEYSRAFLDRYLRDIPFPARLATPHGVVVEVRIQHSAGSPGR